MHDAMFVLNCALRLKKTKTRAGLSHKFIDVRRYDKDREIKPH